jgi:hypothetical protein
MNSVRYSEADSNTESFSPTNDYGEKVDKQKRLIDRLNHIIDSVNHHEMGARNGRYIGGGATKVGGSAKVAKKGSKLKIENRFVTQGANKNFNVIDANGITRVNHSGDGYSIEKNRFPTGKVSKRVQTNYDNTAATPQFSRGNTNQHHDTPLHYDDTYSYENANIAPVGGSVGGSVEDFELEGGGCMCKKPAKKSRSDKGKPRGENDWLKLVKAVSRVEEISYNKALKVASKYKAEGYHWQDFE